MRRRWLCVLLFLACGDPMVDGAYEGEPYLRVNGVFRGSVGEETIHSPKLGVIWARQGRGHELGGLETRRTSISAEPLSNTFSFEVWDLPPPSALVPACGGRVALGALAVYDDVNGDGRIDIESDGEALQVAAPDKALGIGASYHLVYADAPLEECNSPFGPLPALGPGFHVMVSHECETWESRAAFMEVRLFSPADSFPPLRFLETGCSPED